MFQTILDFFNNNVFIEMRFPYNFQVQLFERTLTMGQYLSYLSTIISISIIVVLCALFVYKIIKLIGGLIR